MIIQLDDPCFDNLVRIEGKWESSRSNFPVKFDFSISMDPHDPYLCVMPKGSDGELRMDRQEILEFISFLNSAAERLKKCKEGTQHG